MIRFVRASMRVSVPESWFATHTEPPAIAMPDGSLPTATTATTAPVSGSIRAAVASRLFATQTAPGATASAAGPPPTSAVASLLPDEASISLT